MCILKNYESPLTCSVSARSLGPVAHTSRQLTTRLPMEISAVGYDNSSIMEIRMYEPPLTSNFAGATGATGAR